MVLVHNVLQFLVWGKGNHVRDVCPGRVAVKSIEGHSRHLFALPISQIGHNKTDLKTNMFFFSY